MVPGQVPTFPPLHCSITTNKYSPDVTLASSALLGGSLLSFSLPSLPSDLAENPKVRIGLPQLPVQPHQPPR